MKIGANQTAAVTVSFKNANGAPAKVQGEVEWSSSDDNIAKVEATSEDGLSATITAGPSAGKAEITAVADADLGNGVKEVQAVVVVKVIARGEAVGGEITRVHSDNSLPGSGTKPVDPGYGQGTPGNPARPDNSLPGSQPKPDQGLPNQPGRPSNELPDNPAPKKK